MPSPYTLSITCQLSYKPIMSDCHGPTLPIDILPDIARCLSTSGSLKSLSNLLLLSSATQTLVKPILYSNLSFTTDEPLRAFLQRHSAGSGSNGRPSRDVAHNLSLVKTLQLDDRFSYHSIEQILALAYRTPGYRIFPNLEEIRLSSYCLSQFEDHISHCQYNRYLAAHKRREALFRLGRPTRVVEIKRTHDSPRDRNTCGYFRMEAEKDWPDAEWISH